MVRNLLRCLARWTVFPQDQENAPEIRFVTASYTNQILGLCLTQPSGPIVRISPNEVHFNDPDFIDSLYPGAGERKTNRPVMVGKRSGSKSTIGITRTFDLSTYTSQLQTL
jgi:hypothetical protein